MRTVMSIGAHPDDIEIGCAGTEILLRERGFELIHVVATNGEEGSLSEPCDELASRRKEEARRSAQIIGANAIEFLGMPDGLCSFTKENKVDLIRLIREYAPEIVFTHSSSDHFPDHVVINRLTISAIEAAKGPWYPAAAGKPHTVGKVLGYEVWNPINQHQIAFDISSAMETKLMALAEHFSQVAGVNYLAAVEGLAKYRAAMTMKGEYAEVFELIHADSSCIF